MHLRDLLDIDMLRKLAEANFRASGMPVGIIDAVDGSVLVGFGWQDICTLYHRANVVTVDRCRESDAYIKEHLADRQPCEYRCQNGLRDIGVPIRAGGEHLATLFLGQFFYEGEAPDRPFFVDQARRFGFDESGYLAALDRVPVFSRASVENILRYNTALASFISDLAEGALRRKDAESRAASLARFPQENPDPVLRLNRELDVVYANAAAHSQLAGLGITLGAPAPQPIAQLARRAMALAGRVRGEVATSDRIYSMSVLASDQDVNVYAHEITERKRIEQQLRDADRAKDEFLGMLSHELRNPLAPIQNALYVLDHAEPAGQRALHAKEVAGRQLTHLTRLVDDLLDVTRIVRGKVELRRTQLDVAELSRRTGEDHRALMDERGLRFDVEAPHEPVWVDGDETRIAQVIGNLLQNAAKFTPEGGQVTLAVMALRETVEIRVSDTGSGIDSHLLDHIFDAFVQHEQTLARTEGGLGLGLALVKGLVELHGGTITATSPGRERGSQFVVRLPVLAAATAAIHTTSAAPGRFEPLPIRGRRVLVIEDNEDAAAMLQETLELEGHDVHVSVDGLKGLEAALRIDPEVILCDIGLPGIDGYEVARRLRDASGGVRALLVAVTGYTSPDDVRRAAEAGFDHHFGKPPDLERLSRVVAAGAVTHH